MLISIVVALVVAGLILWAITQFPLDATIVKLIRVVVVVACVLYILNAFFGFGWRGLLHQRLNPVTQGGEVGHGDSFGSSRNQQNRSRGQCT